MCQYVLYILRCAHVNMFWKYTWSLFYVAARAVFVNVVVVVFVASDTCCSRHSKWWHKNKQCNEQFISIASTFTNYFSCNFVHTMKCACQLIILTINHAIKNFIDHLNLWNYVWNVWEIFIITSESMRVDHKDKYLNNMHLTLKDYHYMQVQINNWNYQPKMFPRC